MIVNLVFSPVNCLASILLRSFALFLDIKKLTSNSAIGETVLHKAAKHGYLVSRSATCFSEIPLSMSNWKLYLWKRRFAAGRFEEMQFRAIVLPDSEVSQRGRCNCSSGVTANKLRRTKKRCPVQGTAPRPLKATACFAVFGKIWSMFRNYSRANVIAVMFGC